MNNEETVNGCVIDNDSTSTGSDLTEGSNETTRRTATAETIHGLSMTKDEEVELNKKLVKDAAGKKIFKHKKHIHGDCLQIGGFLHTIFAKALNIDTNDKEKINCFFQTYQKHMIMAVARRRTSATNLMKMNFVRKQRERNFN